MKIYKYIIIAFLTLASACSQDSFFELDRPPAEPWIAVEEFDRAPVGIYATLFGGHEWVVGWATVRVIKTAMADDVSWRINTEWGYHRNTKEQNGQLERAYTNFYRAIAGANNALDFVQKNNGNPFPGESPEVITNNVNRVIGELYFLRAYAYYLLQTIYGHAYVPGGDNSKIDIPLPLTYPTSLAEAKNPPMGTTQQVWDQILSDLIKAKELLPEKYVEGAMNKAYEIRANKFAAAGMLMRTYFQRGEYDKAIQECNFIINENKGEYDLSEDPIEAFNKSQLTARGKEVIFYAPYSDAGRGLDAPHHLSTINHTWGVNKSTWVETHMETSTIIRLGLMKNPLTDTATTLEAKGDKRFRQLMVLRLPRDKTTNAFVRDEDVRLRDITTLWTWKYYRGDGFATNVPLIRLAEVYLTRAACRMLANDAQGAASDLNVVRRRAWDETVLGPFQEVTAQEITMNKINDERLIEMFCEGDRLDYLRGLKVDIPNGDRGPGAEPYTSERFVWVLPQGEFDYNESIK